MSTNDTPTQPTHEAQLRHIQATAEADLATDLRDAGLDFEVDAALLAFRREAAAYTAVMRPQRAQSAQRLAEYHALDADEQRRIPTPPETDADWLAFWQITVERLRAQLHDEATARHNLARTLANKAVKYWRDNRLTRHRGAIPAPVAGGSRGALLDALGLGRMDPDAQTRSGSRVNLDLTGDMNKPHPHTVPAPHPHDPPDPSER